MRFDGIIQEIESNKIDKLDLSGTLRLITEKSQNEQLSKALRVNISIVGLEPDPDDYYLETNKNLYLEKHMSDLYIAYGFTVNRDAWTIREIAKLCCERNQFIADIKQDKKWPNNEKKVSTFIKYCYEPVWTQGYEKWILDSLKQGIASKSYEFEEKIKDQKYCIAFASKDYCSLKDYDFQASLTYLLIIAAVRFGKIYQEDVSADFLNVITWLTKVLGVSSNGIPVEKSGDHPVTSIFKHLPLEGEDVMTYAEKHAPDIYGCLKNPIESLLDKFLFSQESLFKKIACGNQAVPGCAFFYLGKRMNLIPWLLKWIKRITDNHRSFEYVSIHEYRYRGNSIHHPCKDRYSTLSEHYYEKLTKLAFKLKEWVKDRLPLNDVVPEPVLVNEDSLLLRGLPEQMNHILNLLGMSGRTIGKFYLSFEDDKEVISEDDLMMQI